MTHRDCIYCMKKDSSVLFFCNRKSELQKNIYYEIDPRTEACEQYSPKSIDFACFKTESLI